ncbi:tRNA(Ile)-lysidine synthetase [Bacteriovorax sp. BSW11_IV]|uniref:tRNA lysidine(34) synthetase TilS n=1 Tax=Bacteriovorax sp. BSW11_IV TaxID=1353529 RepID=UPI000389ED47|nr:tRNA lysidine(34) synthetase TilS [Bacteriovorax sp. BSW11_IV]EQC43661.1 tRNA(Ile)-lysidine synthetase [Bacteriovorax sp. BSW11_IV]
MSNVDHHAFYVHEFMTKHHLYPANGHIYLALSAGVDSMVLFHLLLQLRNWGKFQKLTCLHVNHGTRKECDSEESYIRKICLDNDVPLNVTHLNLQHDMANFEMMARKLRYDFFNSQMTPTSHLCLGHHIDDSFEWHLMKKFSSAREVLGMACLAGNKARPLMCLTKKQIVSYAKVKNIKWFEDSSNRDLCFERNYLREKIIKPLVKKYPKALKNYVLWANSKVHKATDTDVHEYLAPHYSYLFYKRSGLSNNELERLKSHIQRLSSKTKGKIHTQLLKVNEMIAHGKMGPLHLSGGVRLYVLAQMIVLLKEGEQYSLVQETQIPHGYIPLFVTTKKDSALKNHPLKTLLMVHNNLYVESFGRLYFAQRSSSNNGKKVFFFLK